MLDDCAVSSVDVSLKGNMQWGVAHMVLQVQRALIVSLQQNLQHFQIALAGGMV